MCTFFVCKGNLWNVNCLGQQHSFSTLERTFLRKYRIFETENISPKRNLNPKYSDSCRMIYQWSYRSLTFVIQCFRILALSVESFSFVRLTFEMATMRGQQHSFFDSRTDVLDKASTFFKQKISRPRENLNPRYSDSCPVLYQLSYRSLTLVVQCFWILALAVESFSFSMLIFELSTLIGQQHWFFDPRIDVLEKVPLFSSQKCSNHRKTWTPTFRFTPNAVPVELPGPDIWYPMFLKSGTGGIDIYVRKVNIWNVCGSSIPFWSKNGCSWESVDVFERENVLTQGEFEPLTVGFMLNDLPVELPGPDICYLMFSNTGVIVIFVYKFNVWNGHCSWATTLIFRLKKAWTPTFGSMPNVLPIKLWNTGSGEIFSFVKLTNKMSTVRGQQHSFLLTNGCSWESVEHRSTWYSTKYVYGIVLFCWWRHQVETFSALLVLCSGNSPATGEFPSQRPLTRSFDAFFDPCLNKRLSTQSGGWWFETPSCSLRQSS